MDKHEEERPPFNERAALEQLEQFKTDIERYRQQRKAVGEEFDDFVKSFKASQRPASRTPEPPPAAPPAAPRSAEPPRLETPRVPPAPVEPTARTAPAELPEATAAAARHIETPAVKPEPVIAKPAASERMSAQRAHGITGGPSPVVIVALLLLAAGIAAWFFWPQPTDDAANAPATTSAPATQTPSTAPSEATPPPAPAAAAPSTETVVTTLGPVWLRVIADGVKVREDEFPAGTRIPVDVQKTLVIRTGNAAAVSLTLKGKDLGALGREGQVVTRTFTIPER